MRQEISKQIRNPMATEINGAGCGKCDLSKIENFKDRSEFMQSKIDNEKRCVRCNQLKPITEYYVKSSNKNGVEGICKTCKAIEAKRHREMKRMEKENQKQEDVTKNSLSVSNDNMNGFDTMNQESLQKMMDNLGVVYEDPIPVDFVETNPKRITIDFSDHPDLNEFVRKISKTEFRSPEMMILYMINYYQADLNGPNLD